MKPQPGGTLFFDFRPLRGRENLPSPGAPEGRRSPYRFHLPHHPAPAPGGAGWRQLPLRRSASFRSHDRRWRLSGYAEVFGNLYGTSEAFVDETLAIGQDVILEIDWQGASQVREKPLEAVGVFIFPPPGHPRGPIAPARPGRRSHHGSALAEATLEMRAHEAYPFLVVNDTFDTALGELKAIVQAERLRRPRQQAHLGDRLPPPRRLGKGISPCGLRVKAPKLTGLEVKAQLQEHPMARITVEDCLTEVENRFQLVMIASKRARQLATGGQDPHVEEESDQPRCSMPSGNCRWPRNRRHP